MPLPTSSITVTQHAHVRGWDRFDLSFSEREPALRKILQTGSWYNDPDEEDAFLVLGKVGREWLCAVAKVQLGEVVVTTVFGLTNTGRLDAYKRATPNGPYSADDVAAHYGLG